MKLISARIENFGKLHDVNIDFNDGLNVFLRENGYGKSTLASFIRVMFYGLQGERKTQDTDNDRKRFRPWQGGTFGGELVFSLGTGSKKYRIVRTFGEKKTQDTFMLYDPETNLESTEYTDNIGEEILKIDERSFRKTVFIGQQELETKVTSQINAKIGNVSEAKDDMNRYEDVIENLKDEINSLSPNRRTGEIFKKRMELEIVSSELKAIDSLRKEMTSVAEKLHIAGDEQRKTAKIIEGLNSRIVELGKYQDILKDKINYDNLLRDISDCERRLYEAQRRHFGNQFDSMSVEKRSSEINRGLRELDERFKSGIPEEKELRILEKKIAKMQFLREKLSLMAENPDDYYYRDSSVGTKSGIKIFAAIIAAVALFSGGYLIVSDMNYTVGLTIIAIGVLISLIILVVSSGGYGNGDPGVRGKNSGKRIRGIDDVYDEIGRLSDEVGSYIQKYYPRCDLSDPEKADFEILRGLSNDILRYNRLCDIREFVKELSGKLKDKDDFELSHDMEKLRSLPYPEEGEGSFESLSESLKEQTLLYNEINENILRLKAHMKQIEEELRGLYEKERKYEAGVLELKELEKRYNLMLLVRDHLEKAHNNFTKEYLSPMMSAFEKYYRIFINTSGLDKVPYRMDANFNVDFMAEGQAHSTQLLSEGYKNLVELARRMAFVDAMYVAEKPFIILDDPFVNLDVDKVDGAMKFLDEVSASYQVIYFTCHKSRVSA